jgi:hypothetical protein
MKPLTKVIVHELNILENYTFTVIFAAENPA